MALRSLDAPPLNPLPIKKPSASDSVDAMKASLFTLGLSSDGKKESLLKRLKKAWYHISTSASQAEKDQAAVEEAQRLKQVELEKKDFHDSARGRYKAFLVLDIEGTCESGKGFDYPNEVIEFPVVLVKWRPLPPSSSPSAEPDSRPLHHRQELYVADTFQSYIKPVWRPRLTLFATSLTGISQAQVDQAPTFVEMLPLFFAWLKKHGLDHNGEDTNSREWLWVTDGPFDLRDFVAKQAFISKIPHPWYLAGDVLDLKEAVAALLTRQWEEKGGFDAPEDTVAVPSPSTPFETNPEATKAVSVPPSDTVLLGAVVQEGKAIATTSVEPSAVGSAAKVGGDDSLRADEEAVDDLPLDEDLRALSLEEENGAAPLVALSPWLSAPLSPCPAAPPTHATPSPSQISPSTVPLNTVPPPPALTIELPLALATPLLPSMTLPSLVLSSTPPKAKKRKAAKKRKPPQFYYNVTDILARLNLGPFEGRPHSGIDDAKNIARILVEIESRGILLEPNRYVRPGDRKWAWMSEKGNKVIWEKPPQD